MEKTDKQLASLIEKLQEVGFEQAPEVIEGAIRMIYLDGMLQLTIAGILLGITLLLITLFVWGIQEDKDAAANFGGFGGFFFLVVLIITSSAGNPWAKVFDPEAVLYYDLMKNIL